MRPQQSPSQLVLEPQEEYGTIELIRGFVALGSNIQSEQGQTVDSDGGVETLSYPPRCSTIGPKHPNIPPEQQQDARGQTNEAMPTSNYGLGCHASGANFQANERYLLLLHLAM